MLYRKLTKFRGKDFGKSKMEKDFAFHNQIEFPDSTSLKDIFLPPVEQDDKLKTTFGEIVYLRHQLDFTNKSSQPGQKKD